MPDLFFFFIFLIDVQQFVPHRCFRSPETQPVYPALPGHRGSCLATLLLMVLCHR